MWSASSTTPGQWLEVSYAAPAKAVGVRIHETGNAGTVTKVELVDEGGTAHEVWAGSDGTLCGQWLEVKLPETAYRVGNRAGETVPDNAGPPLALARG